MNRSALANSIMSLVIGMTACQFLLAQNDESAINFSFDQVEVRSLPYSPS